jgi:hemerythrin-like domain-containing protein
MRRDDFDTERKRLEQVLNILERVADRLDANEPVPVPVIRDTVDFIRAIESSAYDASQEDAGELPLSECVQQHAAARVPLSVMTRALPDVERGNAAAASTFVFAAREYVRLRRDHLRADDQLFVNAAANPARAGSAPHVDVEPKATRICYERLVKEAAALGILAPST